MNKAFKLIEEKVKELEPKGYLQHYVNDFYKHDKEYFEEDYNGEEFMWTIRNCGTHLITEEKGADYHRYKHIDAWKHIAQGYFAKEELLFYYNGETLVEITGRPDFVESIIKKWEGEKEELTIFSN